MGADNLIRANTESDLQGGAPPDWFDQPSVGFYVKSTRRLSPFWLLVPTVFIGLLWVVLTSPAPNLEAQITVWGFLLVVLMPASWIVIRAFFRDVPVRVVGDALIIEGPVSPFPRKHDLRHIRVLGKFMDDNAGYESRDPYTHSVKLGVMNRSGRVLRTFRIVTNNLEASKHTLAWFITYRAARARGEGPVIENEYYD